MKIDKCRLCKASNLELLVELGDFYLTGIFPEPQETIPTGVLDLCICGDCGLVQLREVGERKLYFGERYGYSSALNSQMVDYLQSIYVRSAKHFDTITKPKKRVLDIGSNDGTFLEFFSKSDWDCYGIDPSAGKFSENYDLNGLRLQVGFFPEEMPAQWADVEFDLVSAIAMFYDLPDPIRFLESIKSILAPDGKIVIDVGFVPSMISNYALDSVCHEHLSYYSTAQLLLAFKKTGLRIVDSWLSDMNGGTVSVVLEKRKDSEPHILGKTVIGLTSRYEKECRAEWLSCIEYMKHKAKETKSLLDSLAQSGKRIAALGASTKGNTMLQMFDFGQEHFVAIGEVNPEKFGKVTPGTAIPIVNESQLLREGVEVFLVLPWHFRDFFQSASHLEDRILIFMLPELFVRWPVAKESN